MATTTPEDVGVPLESPSPSESETEEEEVADSPPPTEISSEAKNEFTNNNGVGDAPKSVSREQYEPNNVEMDDTEEPSSSTSGSMVFVDEEHVPHRRFSSRRASAIRIDFLQDAPRDMTWGRRIALKLMNKPWYNPQAKAAKKMAEGEEQQLPETPSTAASLNNASSWKLSEGESPPPLAQTRSETTRDSTMRSSSTVSFNDAYPFSHAIRESPSLEKAWAYFEHVALARYVLPPEKRDPNYEKPKKPLATRIVHRFQKANKLLDRAEPGEQYLPSRLYNPVWTPHKQLGDFGLGIGLYFSTLRAIMVLTLVAGLLNLGNIAYFASDEYNQSPTESISKKLLQGSAICTSTKWVPCPGCAEEHENFDGRRLQTGINQETGEEVTFALRNDCEGTTFQTGLVSFATLFLFVLGIVFINKYLTRMEVTFDEDEQTASDYSIVIQNPPADSTDPEEWQSFFRDNFDGAYTTTCTIAVDNDLLVRSLVERREVLRKIDLLVEEGTSLNTLTLAGIAAKQERERKLMGRIVAKILPGIPELFARLVVLTAKIQGLAQQDYPASKVFITFEKEADQRRVLSALDVGSRAAKRNIVSAVHNPKHLFRGNQVLSVKEPDEPSTVRWQDLNETAWNRMKQQALTTLCTLVAVVVIALIVRMCHDTSVTFSAYSIAIFNTAFPLFAKFLTTFEAHASEGAKQKSLYFKIALFRFVNTAVVITIITPFTASLENEGGLISQVYALFFAEIVTTNAIQLADPVGHLKRHFLAPRSKTQDQMNLCFVGQEFELAERYTNVTKILFLTVWYSALYPCGFFMCSFALFVNYFTDRFSLMRTWKRAPSLGTRMSEFSRRFFFPLAVLAMTVISSYYWASFPFDQLCGQDNEVGDSLAGTWVVGSDTTVHVDATDQAWNFCLQDFFRYNRDERRFPFLPNFQREGGEWMTEEQESVTSLWGYTSVIVILLIVLKIIYTRWTSFMALYRGTYDPCGEDQQINFSDVPSISTYIPQVESSVFSYPLLATNMDFIDPDLLEWDDPEKDLSYYDLTKDAEVLLRGTDVSNKRVFSQIFHWPPSQQATTANNLGDNESEEAKAKQGEWLEQPESFEEVKV